MKLIKNIETEQADINALIAIFPPLLATYIHKNTDKYKLTEVVLDIGCTPELRFDKTNQRITELGDVTFDDISHTIKHLSPFNGDNRTGIERTLHRISAMRNREGKIVGLTCRVGRAIEGTVNIIQDIIESGKNCLFLGPPGTGKTTLLRETARVLSTKCNKRVIVVDTSNEIAGDGDIPHPGIGYARRMQVPSPNLQHATMIEAVENHTPECIIVDEIGSEAEAMASRTIAERGVQLIATAHGMSLENLIKNPTLSDLLGGIQSVVLGDEEAKFRGTNKTVSERKTLPTFDILIELRSKEVFVIYTPLKDYVDALLLEDEKCPEFRNRLQISSTEQKPTPPSQQLKEEKSIYDEFAPFLFGVSSALVQNAAHTLNIPLRLCKNMADANCVLTLHSKLGPKSTLNQQLKHQQIDVHALRENNQKHILDFLRNHYKISEDLDQLEKEVLRETTHACLQAKKLKKTIELSPQSHYIRKKQHDLIHLEGLNSMSIGQDPNRRVRIYPVFSQNPKFNNG